MFWKRGRLFQSKTFHQNAFLLCKITRKSNATECVVDQTWVAVSESSDALLALNPGAKRNFLSRERAWKWVMDFLGLSPGCPSPSAGSVLSEDCFASGTFLPSSLTAPFVPSFGAEGAASTFSFTTSAALQLDSSSSDSSSSTSSDCSLSVKKESCLAKQVCPRG